jgi:phosphoglycerol transferase MdoB-like AlkP superfamily enzyme
MKFLDLWIIDSAIRGKDPVMRFMQGLYQFIWIPFVCLALVCILLDINFFWVLGLILKAIWDFWIKLIWYLATHWDYVVHSMRRMVFPGYDD